MSRFKNIFLFAIALVVSSAYELANLQAAHAIMPLEDKSIMALDDYSPENNEEKKSILPSHEEVKKIIEEMTKLIIEKDKNNPALLIKQTLDSVDSSPATLAAELENKYKESLINKPQQWIARLLAYPLEGHTFYFFLKKICSNIASIPSIISNFPSINMLTIPGKLTFYSLFILLVSIKGMGKTQIGMKQFSLTNVFMNQARSLLNFLFRPSEKLLLDEATQVACSYGIGDGINSPFNNMHYDYIPNFLKLGAFNGIFKFIKTNVSLCLPLITLRGIPYLHSFYLYAIFLPISSYLYAIPLAVSYYKNENIFAARDTILSVVGKKLEPLYHRIIKFIKENEAVDGMIAMNQQNTKDLLASVLALKKEAQSLLSLFTAKKENLSAAEKISENHLHGALDLLQQLEEQLKIEDTNTSFLHKTINQACGVGRSVWNASKSIKNSLFNNRFFNRR